MWERQSAHAPPRTATRARALLMECLCAALPVHRNTTSIERFLAVPLSRSETGATVHSSAADTGRKLILCGVWHLRCCAQVWRIEFELQCR